MRHETGQEPLRRAIKPFKDLPLNQPLNTTCWPCKAEGTTGLGVLIDVANMIQAKPPGRETVSKNSKAWDKLIERWNRTDAGYLRGYLHRGGIWIANMQEPPRTPGSFRCCGVWGSRVLTSPGALAVPLKASRRQFPICPCGLLLPWCWRASARSQDASVHKAIVPQTLRAAPLSTRVDPRSQDNPFSWPHRFEEGFFWCK